VRDDMESFLEKMQVQDDEKLGKKLAEI